MPVRWTIHSSDVSTTSSMSRLVITRFGSAAPNPRTTERIILLKPRRSCGFRPDRGQPLGMILLKIVFYFLIEAILGHVVADLDGGSDAFGIGAAMALDDDAVEAEEDAAVHTARIHLFAQHVEGALGEEVADLGKQRARHCSAQILTDLPRCTFGRLQSNIAREAFGHDAVDGTLPQVVAFDEAIVLERVDVGLTEQAPRFLHLFLALDLFYPDIQQANRRTLDLEQ